MKPIRFGLRSLLLVVVVSGIICGVVGGRYHSYKAKKKLVADIQRIGGRVSYVSSIGDGQTDVLLDYPPEFRTYLFNSSTFRIRELSLTCSNATRQHLIQAIKRLEPVEVLNLRGFDDASIQHFSISDKLVKLICYSPELTKRGFEHLLSQASLKEIEIGVSHLPDVVDLVLKCEKLEHLKILCRSPSTISSQQFEKLTQLSQLTTVQLSNIYVDGDLSNLNDLKKLVEFKATGASQQGIGDVDFNGKLKKLDLNWHRGQVQLSRKNWPRSWMTINLISGRPIDWPEIAKAKYLKQLIYAGDHVHLKKFGSAGTNDHLESIEIRANASSFSNDGIPTGSDFSELKKIRLDFPEADQAFLESIGLIDQIETIEINSRKPFIPSTHLTLTDPLHRRSNSRKQRQFNKLKQLWIRSSDANLILKRLSTLPELQDLVFENIDIKTIQFEKIHSSQKLRSISFLNCKVDPEQLSQILAHPSYPVIRFHDSTGWFDYYDQVSEAVLENPKLKITVSDKYGIHDIQEEFAWNHLLSGVLLDIGW